METTGTSRPARSQLSAGVAEEIRSLMGRRNISRAELARQLGVNEVWVGRRVNGHTPVKIDDLPEIARVLGVKATDLLPPAD